MSFLKPTRYILYFPDGYDARAESFTFGDFGTYELVFKPHGKGGYGAATVYERRVFNMKRVV